MFYLDILVCIPTPRDAYARMCSVPLGFTREYSSVIRQPPATREISVKSAHTYATNIAISSYFSSSVLSAFRPYIAPNFSLYFLAREL